MMKFFIFALIAFTAFAAPTLPPATRATHATNNLNELPPELFDKILDNLDQHSLFLSTAPNKYTRNLTRKNDRWKLYKHSADILHDVPLPYHMIARNKSAAAEVVPAMIYITKSRIEMLVRRDLPGNFRGDISKIIDRRLTSALNQYDPSGWAPIHLAAQAGNIRMIIELMRWGVPFDYNAANDGFPTPLAVARSFHQNDTRDFLQILSNWRHRLTRTCEPDRLKRLLEHHQVPADHVNTRGITLLHMASITQSSSVECVRVLLQAGATVDYQMENGQTPLSFAASFGKLDVVKLLVLNGASIHSFDSFLRTPLFHAVEGGYLELAKYLVHLGASPYSYSADGSNLFHAAASSGDPEIINWLYGILPTYMIDVKDSNGECPLMVAVRFNNIAAVSTILDLGADPELENLQGQTPFNVAVEMDHEEIVDLLVVELDRKNCPLRFVIDFGDLDQLIALVAMGTSVDCVDALYERSALMWALLNEQLEIANWLLDENIDVTIIDNDHRTALHYAAEDGMTEILHRILDLGGGQIDINHRGVDGSTALYLAVTQGHPETVNALLKRGADFQANPGEDSLLHLAAAGNMTQTVELLIEAGADLMAKDASGSIPLHSAVQAWNAKSVEFMIARDVGVIYRRNNDGQTAFDLAVDIGYEWAVNFIGKHFDR